VAIREKRNSSLMRAVALHQSGDADAIVSAGHTGAQMAASYLLLGLLEGVRRPTSEVCFQSAVAGSPCCSTWVLTPIVSR